MECLIWHVVLAVHKMDRHLPFAVTVTAISDGSNGVGIIVRHPHHLVICVMLICLYHFVHIVNSSHIRSEVADATDLPGSLAVLSVIGQ